MTPDELRTQQRAWLEEAFSGLFPIAFAITRNPCIAEEVASQAALAAMTQIEAAKCHAGTKAQLCAFVRAIVRNKSKSAIGAGKDRTKRRSLCRGDILADLHAENIREKYAHVMEAAAKEFMEEAS